MPISTWHMYWNYQQDFKADIIKMFQHTIINQMEMLDL
jgi:hypothetical protein